MASTTELKELFENLDYAVFWVKRRARNWESGLRQTEQYFAIKESLGNVCELSKSFLVALGKKPEGDHQFAAEALAKIMNSSTSAMSSIGSMFDYEVIKNANMLDDKTDNWIEELQIVNTCLKIEEEDEEAS